MAKKTIVKIIVDELKRQRPYPNWKPEKGTDGLWRLFSTAYDQPIDVTALAKAVRGEQNEETSKT